MPTGPRPGGRRPRTPKALQRFIEEGTTAVAERAPSPEDLTTPTVLGDNEAPAPVVPPPPEPVSPAYIGPDVDPWAVLRKELSPTALAALEQVTGKAPVAPGTAPWYECWDVGEGRPTGHPPFQGFVKPGQHVYCPNVDDNGVTCGRRTVKPLEGYVPA